MYITTHEALVALLTFHQLASPQIHLLFGEELDCASVVTATHTICYLQDKMAFDSQTATVRNIVPTQYFNCTVPPTHDFSRSPTCRSHLVFLATAAVYLRVTFQNFTRKVTQNLRYLSCVGAPRWDMNMQLQPQTVGFKGNSYFWYNFVSQYVCICNRFQ